MSCVQNAAAMFLLSRDTDGSSTTERVSGDWSAEVLKLAVVKQEPDGVRCSVICVALSL